VGREALMAKFGSFNPLKGQNPYEQVDADYMIHQSEYVQLFKNAKTAMILTNW
jgi:hypothetical protein